MKGSSTRQQQKKIVPEWNLFGGAIAHTSSIHSTNGAHTSSIHSTNGAYTSSIHSPNGHIHINYDNGNNGSTKDYTSNMYIPNRQIHTYSDECNDEW
jgi:hypothetical protein